jgi:hypothetical protein
MWAAWSRETQQLTQQHGRIEAYGRADGLLSDRTMLITRIKLAWQDGTALCFRVQQTEADTLQLLDQHCQDCATPEQDDPAYSHHQISHDLYSTSIFVAAAATSAVVGAGVS